MALPTRGTVATLSANGSAHNLSVTVPASGSLLIYVQFRRAAAEDVTAISRDGQTPTLFATEGTFNGTGWATRVYYLTSANEGTADLSVTLSAGRNTRIIAIPYSGVDTGGTPWGTPTRETDLSTVYGASVTADQELVAVAGAYYATANAQTFTPTGTGQTELDDNRINDQYAAASYQNETGTVTASWTFSATPDEASNWLVTVNGAAAGPTIDSQPTAKTVVLNNDPRTSATFECSAVDDITDAAWDLEDSVGGGTYSEITDGGIYDVSFSENPPVATLVITPVNTDLSGLRVRARLTDAGGETTSDAVALTVYEGPVLSAYTGTTNASGVKTTDLTSDIAGTRVLTTALVNGTVVARTTTLPS